MIVEETFRMSGLPLAMWSVLPVVATAVLTGLVWRRRAHPAARLLLGASVAMLLGSLLHLVVVLVPGLIADSTNANADGGDWPLLVFPVTAIAGGLWLLFALQYTGRGQSVFRVVAAGVIGLTGAAVGTVGLYLGGVFTQPLATDLVALVLLAVSMLAAVGVFVLVGVSVGQNAFPSREPLFFAGGAVALAAGMNVAASFESTLAYTSMLTGAGVLFSRAVARTSAFETLPAAQVVGRDQVIEEMTDAVVVVDRDGQIRDLNAAAEELFETTRNALAGAPFAELLVTSCPTLEEITADSLTRVETADGRILVVRTDRIVGERAGELGYLLVWSDITDQQLREQRLTVLNRVLVRTLGEQIREIRDDAARITTEEADRQATADQVWTTASSLIGLVADARTLERRLTTDQPQADRCEDLTAEVRGCC
jgi:PAS domain S-box